jgi:general secretion pathway protein D
MKWMRIITVVGIGALLAAAAAAAPDETAPVTLDLANADVESVVKLAAEVTGRNFVVDPRVKGTVSVISGQPVPRSQLYALITSALRMQGYAVVESDGVTKVLPDAEARMHTPPAANTVRGRGDRLLTQIFQLHSGTATALVPVLKPLLGANSVIAAMPSGNTLLVTDYAENLRRLADIVAALDSNNGPDIEMIPLHHAAAIDVAAQLTRLFDAPGNGAEPGRLVIQADNRSNSLLVRAGSAQRLAQLRSLAEQLDQANGGGGNIHVVHLKNAEATALARTLRAIVGGSAAAPAPAAVPPTTPAAATTGANPASAPLARVAGGAAGPTDQGGFIQADPATNALIITAPEPVYLNLRQVIDQLDRRRTQVFIEALVVEMTNSLADEFGVQWQVGANSAKNGGIIAGTNFSTGGANIFGLAENLYTAKTTGNLGIASGLNIGFFNNPAGIGGLVRGLASDSRANILSTPSLLTLDNEEARIVVGQNVPFLTGQYAQSSSSATATPFQTIERKDVGLTLRVKPQISEGGTVRLQIEHEVSSVQQDTASGPITSKRSIDSTVLVDDGTIVVLGGLMEDSVTKGTEKIPALGDLPVIGNLFRYNTSNRAKTNLMVFLRPRIVRNSAGGERITADRYADLLDGQRGFNRRENVEDGPQLAPAKDHAKP